MFKYKSILKPLLADRRGITALEYGLVASVLFAIVLVGFSYLANELSTLFTAVGGSLP